MEKTIMIEGMSCEHCVRRVEKALKEIDGITEVKVILEDNKAVVETTGQVEDKDLVDAVSDAGYTVTSIT